jgi:hypothetical protein
MRVSFDSNTWEKIFDPTDRECAPIGAALIARTLEGFICEAGFRIEAIRKRDRAPYFAQPHMDPRFHGVVMRDGRPYVYMSFGPDDARHPGLPVEQAGKLQHALGAGVRLMHAEPLDGAETAVVLARDGPPLGDMCANRTAPTGFDHRCDRLGRAPVTSASTLASDRFRIPPRSPRLAAVRVVQSW